MITHQVDFKKHWNDMYSKGGTNALGWFEENPAPSLRLIEKCHLPHNALILHAGAGASTLIDSLLNKGYQNQIATDISEVALENLKTILGKVKSGQIQWVIDDLTHPVKLLNITPVDLWHDRATLHFFQEEREQKTYFDLVRILVKKDGYVIIAAFNLEGADKCSGLPVFRYNKKMLSERLGDTFQPLDFFNYTYTMPSGEQREYIYTLFRKTAHYSR